MYSLPGSNALNLTETLLLNLGDSCAAAAVVVQAQVPRLHLAGDLARLAPMLSAAGICVTAEAASPSVWQRERPAHGKDGLAGLRQLPAREAVATDIADLGMDIVAPGGSVVAVLELRGVPAGWNARFRMNLLERMGQLIGRQLWALDQGPAIIARPMLALVGQFQEMDNSAASHAFLAFLRVLAGQCPTQVEATALRIAGLAELPSSMLPPRDVALNDVALQLLDQVGLGRSIGAVRIGEAAEGAPHEPHIPVAPAMVQPFARLRLVERDYAVAEDVQTGKLMYRAATDGGDWNWLAFGTADGWTAVAAEILGQDFDTVREFSRMHMIRRRDLPTGEVAEAYDMAGVIWWLRPCPGGFETRLDGGAWTPIKLTGDLTGRERALAALFELVPDMPERLSAPARDWANRMAHTVQVTPFISLAAE